MVVVMDRTAVDFETLASVGYEGRALEIEFTSGKIYQYFDVPSHTHERLMSAESLGGYFNANIRGHFRYARV
jgi:hypothetical protein